MLWNGTGFSTQQSKVNAVISLIGERKREGLRRIEKHVVEVDCKSTSGFSPLTAAAYCLWGAGVAWLLAEGAQVRYGFDPAIVALVGWVDQVAAMKEEGKIVFSGADMQCTQVLRMLVEAGCTMPQQRIAAGQPAATCVEVVRH